MTTRDDYVAAITAGRSAQPGDVNPYMGRGMLADLWRAGYNAMLDTWLANADTRQAELRAQNDTTAP